VKDKITIYCVPGPIETMGFGEQVKGGWPYLLKNFDFLISLNPETEIKFVIGHLSEFGEIPNLPERKGITFLLYKTSKSDLLIQYKDHPSSQHGALLNYVLRSHKLDTETYLIIDPDCYVLDINILSKLSKHILQNKIDFIGAPYPATNSSRYYWDFPTAYFMMMRRDGVDPRSLDFLPDESSFFASSYGNKEVVDLDKPIIPLPRSIRYLFNLLLSILTYWGKDLYIHLFNSLKLSLRTHDLDLFRDTGWKNRMNFMNYSKEMFSFGIHKDLSIAGFDHALYESLNPSLKGFSVWHTFTYGIYEHRNFSGQKLVIRVLNRWLRARSKLDNFHPDSSIIHAKSVFDVLESEEDWGNMKNAQTFYWKGFPVCLHLSHRGKTEPSSDLKKLSRVLLAVAQKLRTGKNLE
jgi:hypothetical protein